MTPGMRYSKRSYRKCYKTLYVRLSDLIQEFEERGAMHLSKTVLYKNTQDRLY